MRRSALFLYSAAVAFTAAGCAGTSEKGDFTPAFCAQLFSEDLQAQAERGNAEAQFRLGSLYARHSVCIPEALTGSTEWLQKAADQGHGKAMIALADHYRFDSETTDSAFALDLYRRAAGRGEIEAMMKLGDMYLRGDKVPQDLTEAAKWYLQAADKDNRYSAVRLRRIMDYLSPEDRRHLEMKFPESKTSVALDEKPRNQTKEGKPLLENANEMFGTIGIALPMADATVGSPTAAIEGTRYKALKALFGIPVGFIMLPVIGAFALPAEVMNDPGVGQVRSLQERFTVVYESYAERNLKGYFHAQMVNRLTERLQNPVIRIPSTDSVNYELIDSADTVLELRLIVAGLQFMRIHTSVEKSQENPEPRQPPRSMIVKEFEARFAMVVNYRVISAKDNAQIAEDTLEVFSNSRRLRDISAWTANDGALLRQSMETAHTRLADGLRDALMAIAEDPRVLN